MRILQSVGAKTVAVALGLSVLSAAVPATVPVAGVTAAKADWHGRHWHGGRGYYHDRYYGHRRYNGGAAVAGALLGLGVGAAIASQPRYYYDDGPVYYRERGPVYYREAPAYYGGVRPWTPAWYRYCSARYRSFDPRSGTFQPYDGPRQLCR